MKAPRTKSPAVLSLLLLLKAFAAWPAAPATSPAEVKIREIGCDGMVFDSYPVAVDLEVKAMEAFQGNLVLEFSQDRTETSSMPHRSVARLVRTLQVPAGESKRLVAISPCSLVPGELRLAWKLASSDGTRVARGTRTTRVQPAYKRLAGSPPGASAARRALSGWPFRLLTLSRTSTLGYPREPARAFRDWRRYYPQFRSVLVSDRDFDALAPDQRKALLDAVALGMTLTLVPPAGTRQGPIEKRLELPDALVYDGPEGQVREVFHGKGRLVRAPSLPLAAFDDDRDPRLPLALPALFGSHRTAFLRHTYLWYGPPPGSRDAETRRLLAALVMVLLFTMVATGLIQRLSSGKGHLGLLLVIGGMPAVSILLAFGWPVPRTRDVQELRLHLPDMTVRGRLVTTGRGSGMRTAAIDFSHGSEESIVQITHCDDLSTPSRLEILEESDRTRITTSGPWPPERRLEVMSRSIEKADPLVTGTIKKKPGGFLETVTARRDLRRVSLNGDFKRLLRLGDLVKGQHLDIGWALALRKLKSDYLVLESRHTDSAGREIVEVQLLLPEGYQRVRVPGLVWPAAAVFFLPKALADRVGPGQWRTGRGFTGAGAHMVYDEIIKRQGHAVRLKQAEHGFYRIVFGKPPDGPLRRIGTLSVYFVPCPVTDRATAEGRRQVPLSKEVSG